ncbi:hypothetical protein Pyn_16619 [Prunus yedoensis var. nudiflora]|uniref:Uncharacterized protein n=1 Tax=Prunus yedoensis var. nudiflora TaxID=2094558 RepID=A0A314UWB1_PRUYE|nr:hypothetical protein Pyn_16619 [Prunus yedoensis var. nudiflora]
MSKSDDMRFSKEKEFLEEIHIHGVVPPKGVYIDPDIVELFEEFLHTRVQGVQGSEHVAPLVNEQPNSIRLPMLIRELR